MQRKLVVEFTKMNGAGNDFIVLDNRFYYFSNEELQELARQYCPRRTGIGADGLLVLQPADDAKHDYRMKYYNADSSLGTMCGNGARCLAAFAKSGGIGGDIFLFESDAGVYKADVTEGQPVRIYVRAPKAEQLEVVRKPELDSRITGCHFIWTGTEHVVCESRDVNTVDVDALGQSLRYHQAFAPTGANVNFIEPIDARTLRVRTFEKGVEAETLACGTGAIASAVIAYNKGIILENEIAIQMKGGDLRVGFHDVEGHIDDVWLEGPTAFVYRGTIEV